MKTQSVTNRKAEQSMAGALPRPEISTEERNQQRQRDKKFIRAMNEFTKKAGLLSDDPFFGGL
ncbi:MAG: hypothetical protein LKI85_03910 [Enterobacter sp.]|nr:hypothetical protein [Enterobacter sp.]